MLQCHPRWKGGHHPTSAHTSHQKPVTLHHVGPALRGAKPESRASGTRALMAGGSQRVPGPQRSRRPRRACTSAENSAGTIRNGSFQCKCLSGVSGPAVYSIILSGKERDHRALCTKGGGWACTWARLARTQARSCEGPTSTHVQGHSPPRCLWSLGHLKANFRGVGAT